MFGRIGPMELILILLIALVIFGPKKLPELGKALGETIRLFKKHAENVSEKDNASPTLEKEEPLPLIEPVAAQAENTLQDQSGMKELASKS